MIFIEYKTNTKLTTTMKTTLLYFKQNLFKKFTFILFLFATLHLVHGQGCAVKTTKKDFENALTINVMMNNKKINQRALSNNSNTLPRKKIIIPYISHIITRANGSGGISLDKINEGIRYANDFFKNIDIELKEYQLPRYINSDRFYDFIMPDEHLITDMYEVDKVLNLYFANSISNSNGNTYCGYAYFPDPNNLENDLDRIFMDANCMGGFPDTTFIHEIGHYLDLFHTHENYRGAEYVNGSNCSTTGDLICDTPADPQLSFSTVDFDCNYTGAETDINGDYYIPNTNNVMSYSRHSCRTELSPMQLEKARFTAENYRIDLKEIPVINQSPYNGIKQTVPGTIEMEFYDLGGQGIAYNDNDTGNNGGSLRSDDVDIIGGNIAWIQAGEWIEYTIDITQTSNYTLAANVSSIFDNTSFSLSIDGEQIGQDFNIITTGDWETYDTISQTNIPLNTGTKTLRFTSITGGFNIDKIDFTLTTLLIDQEQTPYNGTAQTIPGIVQAEFYDTGGQGISYSDTDNGNNGGFLRNDDVDIEKGSVNGNIGWINASEWIEYTIDIKQEGLYTISANVASRTTNNTFSLSIDGNTIGTQFNVPNTGNWQQYEETSQSNINLTTGTKVLRFETNTGKFNLDKLSFELSPSTPVQSPYNGVAQTVPGTIEMEFYDLGGQGIAYNDKDTGNNGNYLRNDDVDMYGGIVAWFQKDEWLEYTINIQQEGFYNISALTSSIFEGKAFKLSIGDTTIGQNFLVPNTNNWENFQSITQNNIFLTAGQKILRLSSLTGGFNINKITITTANTASIASLDTNKNNQTISAYPNPVTDSVTINAPNYISKIVLHNTTGNFIASFNGANETKLALNLNTLKKGNYIATIFTKTKVYKSTIVKE